VVDLQSRELAEKGYKVTIFTFEHDSKLQPHENVDVNIIGLRADSVILKAFKKFFFFLNIFKISRWIRRLKGFDVTIAHNHNIGWLSYFAKKRYGIPYIYYNHPVVADKELFPSLYYRVFMSFNSTLHTFLAKKADYVISVSEYARSLLAKSKIESVVIYNKVSPLFKPDLDYWKIRRQYNLADEPIILFVGRIVPSKKIEMLIDIFKKVKAKIPQAKLFIVGKQEQRKYIEKLKKLSKPYEDSIIFTGFVPDEELPYYYATCDVYATTSFHEGFDLPIVEAQAAKKPVVAFNIGAHKEVVKNGFLIEKGNTEAFAKKLIEVLERRCNYEFRRKEHSLNNS